MQTRYYYPTAQINNNSLVTSSNRFIVGSLNRLHSVLS